MKNAITTTTKSSQPEQTFIEVNDDNILLPFKRSSKY